MISTGTIGIQLSTIETINLLTQIINTVTNTFQRDAITNLAVQKQTEYLEKIRQ